jgi:hypothetical protein
MWEDTDVGLLDRNAVWNRRQMPEDGRGMFLRNIDVYESTRRYNPEYQYRHMEQRVRLMLNSYKMYEHY